MTGSERIVSIIRSIPAGKVASYAQVAELAGLGRGARTVARILHSSSSRYDLPWWRVIRSSGEIALSPEAGGLEQRAALEAEGVRFTASGRIDPGCFWSGILQ